MAKKQTSTVTPMMRQYLDIWDKLPENTLLLFRLGDFYELFQSDAHEASELLGITLTHRHGTPMAGIPYHAAETYINKLLRVGKKVAICDQMEAPQPGKLVKRAVTRILTPGTTLEASQLNANENHYILAVDFVKKRLQAAWLDVSTGGFAIASDPKPENLLSVFNALDPREILVPEVAYQEWKQNADLASWWESFQVLSQVRTVSEVPDFHFDPANGARVVMEALGVLNLEGFGVSREHSALGVASALVAYATENLGQRPQNLRSLKEYRSTDTLLLDPATLRNLEIFKSSQNNRFGTLIESMDATVTAAGGRLLEHYLSTPSLDLVELNRRQQCVGDFLSEPGIAQTIQGHLKKIRDIKRILGRLQNRLRNPRELGAIRDTLKQLPILREGLERVESSAIKGIRNRMGCFEELSNLLAKALNEELPTKLQEGGMIRLGYDEPLDYLLGLTRSNKTWISDLEREEQEKTGIKNLKVKYNGTFGYYIEVTKSNLHLVPEEYIRKQTMTNAERFYTEALKVKEKEILEAEHKAISCEEALFKKLVERTLMEADALGRTAEALAEVDVFLGWMHIALEWNYSRPNLDEGDAIEIEQGRHPVVEQMLKKAARGASGGSVFVPNDTWLKSDSEQIALITGPNMAGKSTFIRQVALITLMAQVGSWVPAQRCHIGLVDRIFSRVGASDELARGNSTFMVEMNETANILNNTTDKSLIILDEIGRGTSTYDGLSIAWSVVEYLHGEGTKKGPRTLFATHYHELTQLEGKLPRLRNYSVSVKEWNEQILFVRQVVPGAADRSYGIQVARLAGLPLEVIDRAKVILEDLESKGKGDFHDHGLLCGLKRKSPKRSIDPELRENDPQMCLF